MSTPIATRYNPGDPCPVCSGGTKGTSAQVYGSVVRSHRLRREVSSIMINWPAAPGMTQKSPINFQTGFFEVLFEPLDPAQQRAPRPSQLAGHLGHGTRQQPEGERSEVVR